MMMTCIATVNNVQTCTCTQKMHIWLVCQHLSNISQILVFIHIYNYVCLLNIFKYQ